MTLDPGVFKAYDVRGRYPSELDEEGAERIGRVFPELTGATRVAVGHDVRLSSPSMSAAFCAGVRAGGADVCELGLAATEMLYFAVADGGFDAGAVITASHNPPEYTGAKLVLAGALPLSGDTGIAELGRMAAAGPTTTPARQGTSTSDPTLLERFVTAALGFVDPAKITGLRVVLDAANGMAGVYLPPVLDRVGIDAVPFFLDDLRAFEAWADAKPADLFEPPRGVGMHETALRGVRFQRFTSPYTLWMVQRPLDAYRALGTTEQANVRRALQGTGLLALLELRARYRLGKRAFKLAFVPLS